MNQIADKIERPAAKSHLQPLIGPEKIGDHWKFRIFDLGEQEGWASFGDNPPVDLRDFKMGINRGVDGEQLVVDPQDLEELAQIGQCMHKDSIRRTLRLCVDQ